MFPNPADGLCADRAPGTVGAARRRRDRRLRAFLKHERLAVAMNMATIHHHSFMKSAVVDVSVQVGSSFAPVTEYVAPAPDVTLSVPSQQLRTGVNLDVTGFVSPLFSRTAVEGSASQVVDPLPLAEEFSEPVCNQAHRERFAAGEMTENTVVSPVVQEQVIVQAIPVVVGSLPLAVEFTGPVFNQAHQEQFAAGEITEKSAEFPVVHEQVFVQAIPRVVGSLPPVEGFTGPVFNQVHQEQLFASEMTVDIAEIPVVHQQVIAGMWPERLVDARGPHGGLERVRHSAVEPPIPGCVVLVQEPEAHDNTTTRYLLKKALQRKEEEEAEKEEEVDVLLDIPPQLRTPAQRARLFELISASSQARRRKRRKRRKRRLPRTSSRLSRCRKLWSFRSCSSSTLSSTSPFVPQRQILMVQTLQQATEYPQLLYVSGGRCPCYWSCLSCRLNGTDMYLAGFPGHAAPRAVFLCFRLAKDASHHGRYAPRSGWF